MPAPSLTAPGQPCRRCGTPVVRQDRTKPPDPRRAYYFDWWLKCPNRRCRAIYLQEVAKRWHASDADWFAGLPAE